MSHPRKLVQDGQIIADQFRLERQLGQGGMGTVWSAEDMRLGRPVAIKFLASEFLDDEQARTRFAREPRLASRIRSPHVVQVYAQGTTDDGVPYLVMELLDGEDLASHIANQGPCSLVETGRVVEQLCRALSRAHGAGLVHRDIKPHNIFLTPEPDGQVFVKLLDFGIAKDVRTPITTLTRSGEVVGSALYVSPEQLREANSVGPSTDIWSLGVVIFEMLTGRVPFDGRSLPELFVRVLEGQYKAASEHEPGLPKTVDAFFKQVIQPDLQKRFQSVDEAGAAFARLVRANSSGFLVRSDRTQPAAAARTRRGADSQDLVTERWPAPWSRVAFLLAMCLALVATVVTALYVWRRAPDFVAAPAAPTTAPSGEAPATLAPALPEQPAPSPAPIAASGRSEITGAPSGASESGAIEAVIDLQPNAADDKPPAKAGLVLEPRRKSRPSPALPSAAPSGKAPGSVSFESLPHNHGF